MEMTQLNIRIPVDLKADGDAVLTRFGKTPSDIIRALWTYMAQSQDLPPFAKPSSSNRAQIDARIAEAEKASAMFSAFCRQRGYKNTIKEIPYNNLRQEEYEELLDEYEALHG